MSEANEDLYSGNIGDLTYIVSVCLAHSINKISKTAFSPAASRTLSDFVCKVRGGLSKYVPIAQINPRIIYIFLNLTLTLLVQKSNNFGC